MKRNVNAALAALLFASNGFFCAVAFGGTAPNSGWLSFRSDRYSFELKYPSDYEVVEPRNQPPMKPSPLSRVWFKERSLSKSPTADREPPLFAIDVFDNPTRQSLDAWLSSSGINLNSAYRIAQNVRVDGVEGLRLTDQAMLAPNSFIYVARNAFVYRITPVGGLAPEMLATVRFNP